jgi:hypothetical protein
VVMYTPQPGPLSSLGSLIPFLCSLLWRDRGHSVLLLVAPI